MMFTITRITFEHWTHTAHVNELNDLQFVTEYLRLAVNVVVVVDDESRKWKQKSTQVEHKKLI